MTCKIIIIVIPICEGGGKCKTCVFHLLCFGRTEEDFWVRGSGQDLLLPCGVSVILQLTLLVETLRGYPFRCLNLLFFWGFFVFQQHRKLLECTELLGQSYLGVSSCPTGKDGGIREHSSNHQNCLHTKSKFNTTFLFYGFAFEIGL